MTHREGAVRGMDLTLLALTAALVGTGLIMVFSSSTVLAMRAYDDPSFFIRRQLLWAGMGFMLLWAVSRVPYRAWRAWVAPLLLTSMVLLVAVLVLPMGKSVGGARRWLVLGPLSFQPAELLKVTLVLYLADILARKGAQLREFVPGLLPPIVVASALAVLLLLQPDLGTAGILVVVTAGMLYTAGARFAHLAGLVLAAVPVLVLLVLKVGYRRRRWDAFLDPWQEPLGKGFQMVQSFLALGSGGLWGRGLCDGQQKLLYLPAPHTDFIFSILGEELGFAGGFLLLAAFGLLLWTGFSLARRCQEPFGKLLAFGLTLLLGVQTVINIGVVTGLVPTKGTPLPFISAGGSSLLFSLIAVGMLLSISRTLPEEEA